MSPAEQAAKVYESGHVDGTFRGDLEHYLTHHHVYSSPRSFIMWHTEPDSIVIYLASGDFTEFFTLPHIPAKWVQFHRRGKPKRYSYERIKHLCNHGRTIDP